MVTLLAISVLVNQKCEDLYARSFSKKNLESISKAILAADFSTVLNSQTPDEKLAELNSIMVSLLDKNRPIIKMKAKKRDNFPWFNDYLRSEKDKRDYLYALWTESRSKEDWLAYKEARQSWQKCNRLAIIEFYKSKGMSDFKN